MCTWLYRGRKGRENNDERERREKKKSRIGGDTLGLVDRFIGTD
jgi:hypothetical protein